ncbi:hypothetical protein ACT3SQ_12190 [Brachybacterium sp. AOP42-C2-15]|uniref:hypothetical protein n=1 Tax=unclassified Brachybacterium TaxID=2623841 RepID=UPI003F900BAA
MDVSVLGIFFVLAILVVLAIAAVALVAVVVGSVLLVRRSTARPAPTTPGDPDRPRR